MIESFSFSQFPKILFGAGRSFELPSIIKNYGSNIALVTGNESFRNNPESTRIYDSLTKNNITINSVIITGEPSPSVVNKTVSALRDKGIDAVVAIGGGSVMDAGKAISAMFHEDGMVEDYLEGVGSRKHSGKKIPFIAMPTTAGTGSEVTKNAVLSKVGSGGYKASLRHDNFIPNVAIIDPKLTLTVPQPITAASGMDCFTQLVEAYTSSEASILTDVYAQEGLKAVKTSLVACYEDGNNIEARSGMSFAALMSGICLANAGLGVAHGFAGPIGGRFNIPHGVICGSLMAPSNEILVRKLRATQGCEASLMKYARLGLLFAGKKPDASKDYYIDAFIEYLYKLTTDLKIPDFRLYGIATDHIYEILKKADCKNAPVRLSPDEMREIFMKRYS